MSTLIKDCTGVILAGGENTRMPVMKAFIKVDGKPVIEKNLILIQHLFKETFIVTNQPEKYSHLNTLLLGDIHNVRGPMTGITTSLLNSTAPWVFVSACDMPFISSKLILYMYEKKNGFDAVVPSIKGKAEPLFAFYSKKLLSSMETAVLSERRGLKDFLKGKKVKYISAGEIGKVDPGARSFINLNTPGDANRHLGLNID